MLTRAQRRLVEAQARADDAKANAFRVLRKPVRSFVTSKVDRSLTRRITGVASTPLICSDGRSFLSRGAILKTPAPLLWEHSGSPIGVIHYMFKSATQIRIGAALYNNSAGDFAWSMFEAGELNGLSTGYDDLHLLAKIDGVSFFNRFRISEVSVVHCPADSDCHFRYFEERGE